MHLIRRNLGWLLVSQFSTWGLSIVLLLIVPHKLGDEAFGQLSFATVYMSFFELIAIFGTATFLMKMVARDNESVGQYVVNAVVLKAIVSVVLVIIAIALAFALQFDDQIIILIAIVCIALFLNTLNNGIIGGLQGLQRMRGPATADVARAYVAGLATCRDPVLRRHADHAGAGRQPRLLHPARRERPLPLARGAPAPHHQREAVEDHPAGRRAVLHLGGALAVLRHHRHPAAPPLLQRRDRRLVRAGLPVGEHAHLLRRRGRHRVSPRALRRPGATPRAVRPSGQPGACTS